MANEWAHETLRVLFVSHQRRRAAQWQNAEAARRVLQYHGDQATVTGRGPPNYWPRLLEFLQQKDIYPNTLYYLVFENWSSSGDGPRPTVLYSTWAEGLYRDYCRMAEELLQMRLESELELFVRECRFRQMDGYDVATSQALVLGSGQVELSALFRNGMADSYGLQNIVQAYQPAALWQYLTAHRVYARLWDRFLPESIRREARAVLDRYYQEGLPTGGPM